MSDIKTPVSPAHPRESELRQGIELLFFAYRDFTAGPDHMLERYGFGRAHHRVIYFVGRHSHINVTELLGILRITKQSLNRVLSQLVRQGFIRQTQGDRDRRQRLLDLTEKGVALERDLSENQRGFIARAYREAGPEAVEGFRKVMIDLVADPADRARFERGAKLMDGEPHLLVVDDDARLRALLTRYLVDQGFRVTTAADAADARARLQGLAFDLLILDVMMPGEDGLALTRGLRRDSKVPILLLTAMAEPEHRILGLEQGADDYLAKPFEPRELVLRIRNILQRVRQPAPAGTLRFGACRLDLARAELFDGAAPVRLTEAETALLMALARHLGDPVTRETLSQEASFSGNLRTVDVQITRLRRKIERDPKFPRYLQTVRGTGYVLKPD